MLAFLPKFLALVLAIPDAVVAAYVTVLMALLFVVGMKIVSEEAADYRKGLIAGIAFWLGVGFQNNLIFPEYLEGFAGGFLENGMTSGGLVAIVLTLFTEVTQSRRHRLRTNLAMPELPRIQGFQSVFAKRHSWTTSMSQRLDAVAEETLVTLLDAEQAGELRTTERCELRPASRTDGRCSSLWPRLGGRTSRIVWLFSTSRPRTDQSSATFRCGYSSTTPPPCSTQQYHELEIVTVHVSPPTGGASDE